MDHPVVLPVSPLVGPPTKDHLVRRSPHDPHGHHDPHQHTARSAPTRLRLELDDRCRALARVIALVEGRGLHIGELRFRPAGPSRDRAEAVIEILGAPSGDAPDRLTTLVARIEALPSVRRAHVERPALAG